MTDVKKSTNVRTVIRPAPLPIRAAFQTLDLVAPGLATRWAMRIWCTPRHARRPPNPAGAGERFEVRFGRSVVVAESWGDAGAPITYLLHGWGGWRGQLAGLVEPLRTAGYRVVALDAPGHGESGPGRLGGRRTHLVEFAEALAATVAATGPAHAVVAHSGGAYATALATRDGLPAGRLLFLAPLANPFSYLDLFVRAIRLGPRARARLVPATAALIGRDLADFDLLGQVKPHDPLPPLLVVHDRHDKEVGYRDGQAIATAWPQASLHTTEGLGHRRLLADPSVIDTVVSYVAARHQRGR